MRSYKIKKESIVIVFLMITMFSNLLTAVTKFKFFGYLDEFAILLFFISIIFSFKLYYNDALVLIVFLYFVIISFISQSNSFTNIIIQSLLHLKFFIFHLLLLKYVSSNTLNKVIKYLFVFTLLGIFFNFILGESFGNFFNLDNNYRSGLLRINGFQLNQNALGMTLVLIYVYRIFQPSFINENFIKIIYPTIIFSLLIFITGSRSSLLGIIISLIFWINNKNLKIKFGLVFLLILLSPFILDNLFDSEMFNVTLTNIESVQDEDSKYIRGIMLLNGFQLMLSHFPFGTGSATFGSLLSEGSSVYDSLGLSNMIFFIEMRGVYDCNVGTIMGEFGFIGIIIYLYLLYRFYFNNGFSPYLNNNVFFVLFILIIFNSFVRSIFQNGYLSIIFALVSVYFVRSYSIDSNQNCNNV